MEETLIQEAVTEDATPLVPARYRRPAIVTAVVLGWVLLLLVTARAAFG